jgi:OOP family OmpA-OmpF porin
VVLRSLAVRRSTLCLLLLAMGAIGTLAPPAAALAPGPPTGGPDTDGDGIADAADACPDESGPKSSDPKKNGCPTDSIKSVTIKGTEIRLAETLSFEVGKPSLKSSSDVLLDELAAVMKTRGANIELVEIAVHSDSLGSDSANLLFTDRRAKAVVDALVARGIAATRLRFMGYGEYCPLDPAPTADARAKNRRVELIILKRGGKKTNATVGCAAAVAKGVVPPAVP